MITQRSVPYYIIQHEELFPPTVDEYLTRLFPLIKVDIVKGACYPFDLEKRLERGKLNPFLRIAYPEDAQLIADICKEVYDRSYPYKEMEDPYYIKGMIESTNHYFILFQTETGENAGCFHCTLDLTQKKGYMGGFMVRKKFQGKLDVVKAIMGSYIWMWNSFKDDILVWYCENRTAHASSQYITAICGINSIAFFPNKDVFFRKIESDVMGIIYTKKVLEKMRSAKIPTFIPSVKNCFGYSNELYGLGQFIQENPVLNLNWERISSLNQRLESKVEKDQYGYRHYTFRLKDSSAYFHFLHNTHIQNFEKAKFQVSKPEELYVFILMLQQEMNAQNIRYCEFFISAYDSIQQKILYNFGFRPRGYVPCWKYDKETETFEDYIVFNYFEGDLAEMALLRQGYQLLSSIEI